MEQRRHVPKSRLVLCTLCLLCLLTACSGAKQGDAGTESPDRVGEILYEHVMAQNDALTAENRDLKVQISRLEVREREVRGTSLAFREPTAALVRVREDTALLWMPSGHEMQVGTVPAGEVLAVTVEGTDEAGRVWLLARRSATGTEDVPPLAGWIRQDRTESAAPADAP